MEAKKTQTARILYIDDEINNLNSFRASFRNEFEIHTAISAQEASVILENQVIHIIIADQRMPVMTGVEFFESILPKYPDSVRILLTAYSDITSVVDAINKGHVYQFIDKPWDFQQIKQSILRAFDYYNAINTIKNKNQELLKAYQELDKFVYSTSHDLRSPLASIKGIIEIARLDNDPSKLFNYINMIDESASKMDEFIQNIVNYYKISRIVFSPKEIELTNLVSDILEGFSPLIKSLEIDVKVEINETSTLITDEEKLRIILTNLISNAIKFQNANNSKKRISIEITSNEKDCIIIISDNGISIDKNLIDKIFDMFYRATDRNPGSGLGLYIVNDTVKQLSGKINVESSREIGTSFTVEIKNYLNLAEINENEF